ncbi:MAG TPA: efflux transporter outer membrane subunit [Xanthobacteraceae bacterium]|nr:efflux transporter outer membrane subunit [Xanthobacteraceae bacterium]
MSGDKESALLRQETARRTQGCAAILAAGLLSLAGCLPNVDRPDAALDVPDGYRAASRSAPDLALPPLDWWRGFRSSELTALIEEAQSVNLDIAAAAARISQADAQARIAGAALLPTIDANGSGTHSRSSIATGSSGGGAGFRREGNVYQASLSASYEVDFWGKNRALLEAARYSSVASRFDREVIALSTIASVANTYFQILAAQDRLANARENVRAASHILDLVKQRYDVGSQLATALELAQQQALVAQQRAQIPPLVQTIKQSTDALATLIARPPERVIIHGGSMRRLAIPRVTPGLPSDLLTRRPDIREAEANLAAANANVYAARAAFLPNIQLTGQDGFQSAILRSLFRPEALFFSIAASVTQPIFDGGTLLGQLEQQKGKQEELLQTYRKTIISGFQDVDDALVAVKQQTELVRLDRAVVEASKRAYDVADRRFQEGTVDLVNVLQTEQTLFQARDALALAELSRLQAIVSLYQALGGGWPPPEALIAEANPGGYIWSGIPLPATK